MDTRLVPVPALSPWVCKLRGPAGRTRWVTGLNWPGSSWFLLILALLQFLARHACRQTAKQLSIASHKLERGKTYETFLDFLAAGAGTGTSLCTGAFASVRHIVLRVTTGNTERVTCPPPTRSSRPGTWHIFKAINFISSLGCAASLIHSSKQLN